MTTAPQVRGAIIAHWGGKRGTMRRQGASRGASIIVPMMIHALKAGHAIAGAANVWKRYVVQEDHARTIDINV